MKEKSSKKLSSFRDVPKSHNDDIGGDVGVLEAITSLLGAISAVTVGILAAITSGNISKEVKTVANREKHHTDPVRNTS